MLYKASALDGFSLGASDGDIGTVEDFYFDDEAWAIRYLAVDTGGWLSGRKVLISPPSLEKVDWDNSRIEVKLSRGQIENSPAIDTHKPISRQHETRFYDYYGYPYYWGGPYMWGPAAYPGALYVPPVPPAARAEPSSQEKELRAMEKQERAEDQHLRSSREVTEYYIEARDGDIGHIEDFILDDSNWAIRYVVIDTKNWWPGKKVVIAPKWITSVSWNDSKARVDLTRDQIKQAPEYDAGAVPTREYEERVHRHYGRESYW